jgi:hypothetical protein
MNKEKLREIIFISLGRASMCWSEVPRGVFDSTTAAELGEEIVKAIEEYVEDQTPGWSEPLSDYLEEEIAKYKDVPTVVVNRESEWQKRKRIETMKEAKKQEENYKRSLFALKEMQDERELIKKILDDPFNADGFSDDDHRNPKYNFEGFTYILNAELTRILGVEVPSAQVERHWLMEDLREKDEAVRRFKLDDSFKKALEEAVVSDTPASSWMDEHREEYDKLLKSGMFFEFHPTWTGEWDKDKYAFCYDKKYENKKK